MFFRLSNRGNEFLRAFPNTYQHRLTHVMPNYLQNLTSNRQGENMYRTWVSMVIITTNHEGMGVLHGLSCLSPIDYSVYMYVNKCLQLPFDGL